MQEPVNGHPYGFFAHHFYACLTPHFLPPSVFAHSLPPKERDELAPVSDAGLYFVAP
jgi:hypothetical protein